VKALLGTVGCCGRIRVSELVLLWPMLKQYRWVNRIGSVGRTVLSSSADAQPLVYKEAADAGFAEDNRSCRHHKTLEPRAGLYRGGQTSAGISKNVAF